MAKTCSPNILSILTLTGITCLLFADPLSPTTLSIPLKVSGDPDFLTSKCRDLQNHNIFNN